MGKFIGALALGFILFSGRVSLDMDPGGVASQVRFNAEQSSDEAFNDPEADYVASLQQHVIVIREDIKVVDIYGGTISLEGATGGTGAVIEEDSGYSLILTANHVCQMKYPVGLVVGGRYRIVESKKVIVDRDSNTHEVEILAADFKNDVCIMDTKTEGLGVPATISAFHPPVGAKVITAGAPDLIWIKGAVAIAEGRYSGQLKEPITVSGIVYHSFLQFSIPTVGGMSGSPIFYKGRIVAVLTAGYGNYENVCWGPGLGPIRVIHEKSLKMWKDKHKELRE